MKKCNERLVILHYIYYLFVLFYKKIKIKQKYIYIFVITPFFDSYFTRCDKQTAINILFIRFRPDLFYLILTLIYLLVYSLIYSRRFRGFVCVFEITIQIYFSMSTEYHFDINKIDVSM